MKRSILKNILAALARAAVRKYKPVVIGVTGSVGKTSARLAIYAVVKGRYRAATAERNYNNEVGLPLTVLGIPHGGESVSRWAAALAKALQRTIFYDPAYPELLVLEYGVDRPGDMDYLLSIARPAIAVVTAIGDIPAHAEFFSDPDEVIAEKTKIVVSLPAGGWAVLNGDDEDAADMKRATKAHVMTFGVEEEAAVRITNPRFLSIRQEDGTEKPEGLSFKLSYKGGEVPVRLDEMLGMPAAYAAAAAAGVGAILGMNLVEIAEALRGFLPAPGRMRLVRGTRGSYILDDTYNAAPEAMRAALDTLAALPGRRKIAVLGDMAEIGRYAEQAHRAIGDRAAEFVDLLFCVGAASRFIADEARTRGVEAHARRLTHEQVFVYDDALEAGRALETLLSAGDLVLVKGSRAMRMEYCVEEIMAEPERAADLLVRQDEDWRP